MTGNRYIFGGGGTGGHLYPGLAIWREIQAMDASASAVFVCSSKPLDAEILGREQVAFVPVPAKAFGVRPLALWRFLSNWGASVRVSRGVIRGHGHPIADDRKPVARERGGATGCEQPVARGGGNGKTILVSMGGYVSAPVVQAARAEGVPCVLVNLDAVPGKANSWIARHADVRMTAADSGRVPSAWERVPPIVRRGAKCAMSAREARAALGLKADRPVLLVTGGSQGAGSLNAFVTSFAAKHAEVLRRGGWQVLHQTGKGEDEKARAAYAAAGIDADVRVFLTDMACAWGAATFSVARCGANTVAELWANQVPSLLLPYPYHKDEHQKFNAEPLERCGGALVRRDHVDVEGNLADAGAALLRVMEGGGEVEKMQAGMAGLGAADGAARVARRLVEM